MAGLVALLYFLGGKLGLAIASQHESVAAVWPPSGLLLAALTLVGFRRWTLVVPAAFISIGLLNHWSGRPAPLSLWLAVANCAESTAAAWVLLRLLGGPPRLDRLRDVLAFVGGAVVATNAATATLAAWLIQPHTGGSFWGLWRLWWIGDGVGMLVVAPLVLSVARLDRREWSSRRLAETLALSAVLLALAAWAFNDSAVATGSGLRLPYLLIPAVLLLSLRIGPDGAAIATFVVTVAAAWSGVRGAGLVGTALVRAPGEPWWLSAEMFLATLAVTGLVAAALYAERLRAERSLREERWLLDGLVEGTTDAVYVKDLLGRYRLFNRAASAITGRTSEEVIGRDDTLLFPPDEARTVMQADRAVMEAGEPSTFEETVTAADGSRRTFLSTKGPLRDDRGAAIGLFGIARDVTGQRWAAAELRHSHELMSHVIEHARGGIAVFDRDLRYIYVSERYLKEYHVQARQVIGRSHYDVFPEIPQRWREVHQRALAGEILSAEEDPFLRNDGSIDWTRWECRPWHEADGSIGGIILYTEVITDRLRAREALRASEARFRTIFDAAPVGIAVSRGGRQLFVNAAYASLFGYRGPADVEGTPLTDQLAPEVRESLAERNRRREAGHPSTGSYDTLGLRQDGTAFPMHVDALGIHLPDGPATLAFLVDLSDRKRADEERAALEAQLRQAQKMEAIGTLAGGIAHDFNNILTPVVSYAELALMQLGESDPAREDLRQLLAATERATALVKQILAFSRQEEPSAPVAVRLSALVKETARFLRASLPATIEINTEIDPACGPVLGNPSQLHQVLLNLCTNAGYSMRERGGTLTVSLRRADAAALGREGRWVRLEVGDTGAGIPPEIVGRIFEPYFTTKPVGKGSGLGLAVVHAIVAQHGGDIRVANRPGNGAVFEVWLPEAEDAAEPRIVARPEVAQGIGQHVLVVDDEPAIRRILERMLAALGYRVTTAAGGAEALAAFRADPGAFDAVLTDQTMPGMSGLDLLGALLELRPGLPVVLGTGFSEVVNAESATAAGARALVMKPYDRMKLGEALRRALRGASDGPSR